MSLPDESVVEDNASVGRIDTHTTTRVLAGVRNVVQLGHVVELGQLPQQTSTLAAALHPAVRVSRAPELASIHRPVHTRWGEIMGVPFFLSFYWPRYWMGCADLAVLYFAAPSPPLTNPAPCYAQGKDMKRDSDHVL